MKINIPTTNNQNFEIDITNEKPTILIGANGSGKTRLSINIGEQIKQGYKNYQQTKNAIERLEKELIEWDNQDKRETAKQKINNYANKNIPIDNNKQQFISLYFFVNLLLKQGYINKFTSNRFNENIIPPQSIENIEGGTISSDMYNNGEELDIDLIKFSEKYRNEKNIEKTVSEYINYQKQRIVEYIQKDKLKLKNYQIIFKKVHRISAHRQLTINTNLSSIDLQAAKNQFTDPNNQNWKNSSNNIQNDFDKLIIYLYSEHYQVSAEYLEKKQNDEEVEIPKSQLNHLITFWNKILPHRELFLKKSKIEVKNQNNNVAYNPSEMSDGERNIFYILGQCLLAEKKSLLIIDEPELHINRSLMHNFWNYIKEARRDCAFLFITHDIDFIHANSESQKYFIKQYQHENKWDLEIIDDENEKDLLEEIKFSVWGSRKNVIFVEGEKNSLDFAVYSKIYSNYLIIPVESCEEVKRQVKSLNKNKNFHHINFYGIIDRDSRSDNEVENLLSDKIYCLKVAMIENIFLLEEVISAMVKIENNEENFDFKEYKNNIFVFIKKHKENDITKRVKNILEKKAIEEINKIKKDNIDLSILKPKEIYENLENELEEIIENKNLDLAFSFCRNKGLYKKILKDKNILNCDDVDLKIKSLLKNQEVLNIVKDHLPNIKED